ncbi:MAG: cyclic nucleotide-binding domain-containing protein [Rhodospirillaceae bacterium]|jgi:CRP/FNR family transcriptional regulator, cyclic AMP receptor protein|nr:cyclic nucleotide-binding domain-containing protein [Rhodospirillaceae bacterium]
MLSAERGIKKKFFRAGDFVFNEGEPGDMAFIIETGTVGIFKTLEGQEVQLATMVGGELFGEMSILDGSPRMANARAMEDAVVITLPRDILETKLGKAEPFLKSLVQILVDNLRNVHRVYMHRPRSVQDFLGAVSFHTDGLTTYLEKMNDHDLATRAAPRVKAIATELAALREIFDGHVDRRHSALKDADVTRRRPDA